MTVGAKTCGIGNWVVNLWAKIIVGSSGICLAEGGPDAAVLVPMEVDLSPQRFNVTKSDTTTRTKTPPVASEVMRFCFAMIPLLLWLGELPVSYAKKQTPGFVRSVIPFPRRDVASRACPLRLELFPATTQLGLRSAPPPRRYSTPKVYPTA